jgi:hypothetical protein
MTTATAIQVAVSHLSLERQQFQRSYNSFEFGEPQSDSLSTQRRGIRCWSEP